MNISVYENLVPIFAQKLEILIENCEKKKVFFRQIDGLRNSFIQGIYWKRSRNKKEIDRKLDELKEAKAYFLAYCISAVGPHIGPHCTNAIPGYSWHQWGEAADFTWTVNGKPEWDTNLLVNNVNGYQIYANEAKTLGLECGFYWSEFPDAGHLQYRAESNPGLVYSICEIDRAMQTKYEHLTF